MKKERHLYGRRFGTKSENGSNHERVWIIIGDNSILPLGKWVLSLGWGSFGRIGE